MREKKLKEYIGKKELPLSLELYVEKKHEEKRAQSYLLQENSSQDTNFEKDQISPELIAYFEDSYGKLCFYIKNNKELLSINPLIKKMNCSILLLCEKGIDDNKIKIRDNIQAVTIDLITKVKFHDNYTLNEYFPNFYTYYNTIEIILFLLKPSCMFIFSNGYKEQILKELCKKYTIPIIKFQELQNHQNSLNTYIYRNIPYGSLKNKTGLHIGCSHIKLKGWFNSDIECDKGVYYLNAGCIYPFPNSSFKYIYSEHLFEHLNWQQELTMLSECHRVLKENGRMRIAMPNMEFLIDLYLHPERESNKRYLEWSTKSFLPEVLEFYGSKSFLPEYVINNFFKNWGHQIIHTPHEFVQLAKRCGFHNIKPFNIGKSDTEELENIEHHGYTIPKWANEMETFIFEMTK